MRNFRILFASLAILINLAESFGQTCSKEQLPLSLQQGLVAYYPFCGNTNDESGFGNHIQNFGATLVNGQIGNTNGAFRFDGLTTYMQIPYASSFEALTDNFTFSFWIKNNKISPHDAMHVIHRNDGSFTFGIGGNSELGFARQGQAALLVSDSTLKNEWTHVLFTMNGLTKSLYLNGVLNKSVVSNVAVINPVGALMNIGIASPGGNGGAYRLEADISQMMWYNRVLSADEVKLLYNSLGGIEKDCETMSQIKLLNDTTTLFGSTPKILVPEGFSSYLWNTGDTTNSIDIDVDGVYVVSVIDSQGCRLSDTTSVIIANRGIIASDTLVCSPQNITLSIRNYASYLSEELKAGLVGNYPFDGNGNDISGNNRNLQQFGVEASTDRFGNSAGALLFQNQQKNVTDYLRATNDEDFKFRKYTFSFWLNTSSFYQVGGFWDPAYQGIITFSPKYWNLGPSYNLGLSINDNSQIGMEHWAPASVNAAGTPLGTIQLGQWYHVGVTYDSTTIRFYLNGQVIDSVDAILSYVGQTDFLIGARGDGPFPGGYFGGFNGKMDDLMIWDRALSGTDISTIYQAQQAGQSTSASILWSTGDTTPVITVISQADTTISVDVVKDGVSETFSIDLKVGSSQTFNPFSDTIIIKGKSSNLNAGSGFVSYSWNTSDTSSSIEVSASGLYIATVETQEGCNLSDSTYLILNNLEIVASDTLLCDTATINLSVPVDMGSFKFVGSFGESDYFIDTVSRSWPQAREAARAQGMDLWVIENQVENDSVYSKLPHVDNVLVNYWIGLFQDRNSPSYSEPVGGWKWVDGTVMNYSNWLAGDPNNQSGWAPGWEDYGLMWTAPFHGKWNDFYSEIQDPSIIGQFKTLAVAERSKRKYNWSTGDTTASISVTPLINTDYILMVDENGIIFSDTISIKVSPKVEFNPLPDTLSVCGENSLIDAGSGFVTYTWNTGSNEQTLSPVITGLYTINVKNEKGCNYSDSVYLSIINLKLNISDTSICLGDQIKIEINYPQLSESIETFPISLRSGILGYYPFNGNANNASGKSLNGVISGATLTADRFGRPNKAYHFNGNSYIGMGSIPEFSIRQGSLTTSSWFKSDFSQTGNIIRYDNGNTSGGWGILAVNSNPNQLTLWGMAFGFGRGGVPVLSTNVSNNEWHHVVHVIDSSIGKTKLYIDGNLVDTYQNYSESIFGIDNTKLYVGVLNAVDEFWKGDIDDILIYNRALSDSEILRLYQLTPPQFNQISWSTGDTSSSIRVSPRETTTYTLTVTDGITTCSDQVTITVAAVDTSITALDALEICPGTSTRLQAGTGSSYKWLRDGVAIPGATSSQYAASAAGDYCVVVTNANGCSDTSRVLRVTMKVNPQAGSWNTISPVCSRTNTTTLQIGGNVGQLRWQSSINGTTYVDIVNLTDSSYQAINLTNTTYYRVIATNSCASDTSAVQTVIVNHTPVASFTVNSATQALNGNLFVFTNTSAVSNGDTYLWNLGNGFTNTTRNISFTYTAAGTYTVSLTVRSALGCESTVQQNVQVVDLPESGLISGSAAVCGPVNSNVLSVTGSSGTLHWQQSTNNLTFTNINGVTGTNYTASNLLSTTYYRVIATKNGLNDTSTVATITVNPKPVPSFTVNTASQVLTNNSFVFTNTSTGGSTYLWRFGNGATATTQNATYSYTAAGSYVVRLIVTTAAGCKDSTSSTVTVTTPPPPPPPPVVSGNLFALATTCAQFNGNTGTALTRLCYTVSSGRVSGVTPASFMYYVKVTAPSASFTVNIAQTVSRSGFRLFTVNTGGSVASGDNCVKVASVTTPSTGQARVSITKATVGRTYIIGVRYDTKSLVGYTTNGTLNASYGFSAKIGNATLPNSTASVMLYPNNCVGVSGGQVTGRLPEVGGLPGAAAGVDKTGSDTKLQIRVYPNPSNSRFTVFIESSDRKTKGTLRIMNAQGQVVEEIKDVLPGSELEMGMKYLSGTYTAVFIQGNQTTRQRLVKY